MTGTVAYLGGLPAVLEEFCWAWSEMRGYTSRYLPDVSYDRATVSDHSFARNWLVDHMKGDWLLQMDADHVFAPDIAVRMVRLASARGIHVLTGLYQYKHAPHAPMLFKRKDNEIQRISGWDKTAELIPIDAAGAGCLLVHRRVFDRIRSELNEQPFDHRNQMSEDASFFDRCYQLKIPAYCAAQIESYHLEVKPVSLADYKG